MLDTRRLLLAALTSSTLSGLPLSETSAQPAPIPRAVITAQDPPEAARGLFEALPSARARDVHVPGAAWLQLRFREGGLREGDRLVVASPDGQTQRFTAAELDRSGGLTAIFNGDRLSVRIEGAAAQAPDLRVAEIIVGLPSQSGQVREPTLPAPLRDFLGPRPERFRAMGGAESPARFSPESICGATDDRTASTNPLVGRIMPIGCTGWLIDRDRVLTAGHCRGAMDILQFNVPRSRPDGTVVNPGVRDQYRIDAGSVVGRNTGIGDDWAVFRVFANTETGVQPAQAQGGSFRISRTDRPAAVRITGYGTDDGADNQTQQTHAGAASAPVADSAGRVRVDHSADTTGGNSGGPIINEADQAVSIGIHTNAGCTATGGQNAGTSFGNDQLWNALTGGWASLGGEARGMGGAVLQTGGRLVVFARGTDNAIWHRWQTSTNGAWSNWESLGGTLTSDPDAALNANGRLVVFARGTDNAIWHRWQDAPDGQWR